MFNLIVVTKGYYQSITFQVSTASREGLQPFSFICSGYEPFREVEHFTVRKRWNIPANIDVAYSFMGNTVEDSEGKREKLGMN